MRPTFPRLLSLVAFIVAPLVAVAPPAAAGVFLNGVNIDGVTGQTFENCTVTIDEKGNVLITAKGYEVQGAPTRTPEPARPVEPVTKRYFLVSEQPEKAVGLAQYDIDVFVNSKFVKRIVASDQQVVLEITRQLHKGRNTIHFTATKNLKEGRKSTTPAHFLKVHIGEGDMGGNNLMIENQLLEYTRTAAETQTFDDDFAITGR
jgi:hypothetical protein